METGHGGWRKMESTPSSFALGWLSTLVVTDVVVVPARGVEVERGRDAEERYGPLLRGGDGVGGGWSGEGEPPHRWFPAPMDWGDTQLHE